MKAFIASLALVVLLASTSNAFVPPRPRLATAAHVVVQPTRQLQPSHITTTTRTSTQLHSYDTKQLTTFFLETVISNGVPALFTLIVIAFAANAFRPKRSDMMMAGAESNAISELYTDLYGDGSSSSSERRGQSSFVSKFLGKNNSPQLVPLNTGIPSQQYIRIESRNAKLDSYQYSMTAATKSKALAAAMSRERNFERALGMAGGASANLTAAQKTELLQVEKEFLSKASQLQSSINSLQAQLTKNAIDEEMKSLGMTAEEMDPYPVNLTTANTTITTANGFHFPLSWGGGKYSQLFRQISTLQENLLRLELNFVQDVISILGPSCAIGVRQALLGDVSTRGAGGLLDQIQTSRPLSQLLSSQQHEADGKKNLYVTEFPGDLTASQVEEFREEVTAIVRNAKPGVDEALVVLQSGGGTVTGYGLAAAQLQRFKENGMKLTICVEQVAASGGYMMCCVADRIIASPFAVLGSIGVISDIPNVYERLQKEGIEFQTITAGKYKRTVTPTKKITKEDVQKSKEDIEDVLKLFKTFVKENRPSLDIEKVATGETWFGTDALALNLCDEIRTVDEVVTEYVDKGYTVYDVKYEPPVPELQSELSRLLPIGGAKTNKNNLVSRAVRWLARTVASEFTSELDELQTSWQTTRPDRKYMMKDDTADRIRID